MDQRKWWVRGVVLGSALLLAPVGAWADKLTELEQAFETQQKSLQQLQQEMHRLRQDRTAQQTDIDRRVMEVEKKAADAAASSLLTGYEGGKGFFLKSADDQFRLNLSGYVQNWMQVEGALANEAETPNGIKRHDSSTFKMRRARIILSGTIYKDFGFHIEPELVSGGQGTRLEAAFATYTYAPWAKVKVGQFRDMYSLEMATASQDLDFAERAVVVRALAPDLQMGLMVSGNLKLANVLPVYYGLGIFNGCGRVDQCPTDNDGDKEFTGRFAFSPPMPIGNLTIGLNADHRNFDVAKRAGTAPGPTPPASTDGGAFDLVTSRAAGTKFHRFNPIGPTGDTLAGLNGVAGQQQGFLINGDRNTGGVDFVFDWYPFIVKGEYHYALQKRNGLGAGGADLDELAMQGTYGTIGYWIFGNKRNGLLANTRYEFLRVDDRKGHFDSATTGAATEQTLEMQSGTLGLTWYVNPSVWVRGNYIVTDLSPNRNQVGMSNSHGSNVAQQGIAELMVKF
jgi:phosphate-selective porin OprO and OprP